jgi:hypothetical protein
MLKLYFSAGKWVIIDSGFCVLKAIIELKRHGIYTCALIKKRRFWPSGIPMTSIDDHMADRDVGDVDAIQVTADVVTYNLWAMKKTD